MSKYPLKWSDLWGIAPDFPALPIEIEQGQTIRVKMGEGDDRVLRVLKVAEPDKETGLVSLTVEQVIPDPDGNYEATR